MKFYYFLLLIKLKVNKRILRDKMRIEMKVIK